MKKINPELMKENSKYLLVNDRTKEYVIGIYSIGKKGYFETLVNCSSSEDIFGNIEDLMGYIKQNKSKIYKLNKSINWTSYNLPNDPI